MIRGRKTHRRLGPCECPLAAYDVLASAFRFDNAVGKLSAERILQMLESTTPSGVVIAQGLDLFLSDSHSLFHARDVFTQAGICAHEDNDAEDREQEKSARNPQAELESGHFE